MDEYSELLMDVAPKVKKLSKMINKAKKFIPETSIAQTTSKLMEKMVREGQTPKSILSQDEEFYSSDSFIAEVTRIENDFFMEMALKERVQKKKDPFNPLSLFDLGLNNLSQEQSTQGEEQKNDEEKVEEGKEPEADPEKEKTPPPEPPEPSNVHTPNVSQSLDSTSSVMKMFDNEGGAEVEQRKKNEDQG